MHTHAQTQRGVSLVEVLVAMVILAVGLLGLVGLQGRLHVLQMESYQRAQALILLHDMASRVMLNRSNADDYVTGSPLGEGADCSLIVGATRAIVDSRDWCNAIQGSAETIGVNTKVGAMLGGRGCVESLGSGEYLVTVAWQGLGPVSAPPDSVDCGVGDYDDLDPDAAVCVDDLCRRVVTTVVRIADLT